MTPHSMTRIGLALTAALTLVACGNDNDDATKTFRQLPKALFGKKEAPQPVTPQQMAKALTSTTASVFWYEIENYEAQFLLLDIQRSGPYQSYGNSARQVILMRNGMITSTRGFGGDLMSSEEDALVSRVLARTSGTVAYDQRFLTPEDVTAVSRYSCAVVPGGTIAASSGLAKTTGQVVTADCTAADGVSPDFTNTYTVSGDGYVISSKQWLGPTIGYIKSQVLRR
jgi:hypothetical protein